MYPYLVYIYNPNTEEYSKVVISNYREYISIWGFNRLMLKFSSKYRRKFATHLVYKCAFQVGWCEHQVPWGVVVRSAEMPLYEYYKEIGFDRKSKKIHGKTLYQLIKLSS